MKSIALVLAACLSSVVSAAGVGYPAANCGRFYDFREEGGTKFVSCGASHFIADATGRPVSDGYHAYSRLTDGKWIVSMGNREDLLDAGGAYQAGPFLRLRPRPGGYRAILDGQEVLLDSNGQLLVRQSAR